MKSALEELRKRGLLKAQPNPYPTDWATAGYIYIFVSQGRYKIGQTAYADTRLRVISTSSAFPVRRIALFYVPDYKRFEKALHSRYASRRKIGEWFEFTPEEIKREIKGLYAHLLSSLRAEKTAYLSPASNERFHADRIEAINRAYQLEYAA